MFNKGKIQDAAVCLVVFKTRHTRTHSNGCSHLLLDWASQDRVS